MEIEKEVRYKISELQKVEIIDKTEILENPNKMIDLVMGWSGFESLSKYGFICRIREKNGRIELQVKKRVTDSEWKESRIKLNSFEEGYEILKTLKMEPYLYINRVRQVRKYKDLKIFLDEIDLLGNYVEIEFQDSKSPNENVEEFIKTFKIENKKEKLYGDIFKEKIEKEKNFKDNFINKIQEFLKR